MNIYSIPEQDIPAVKMFVGLSDQDTDKLDKAIEASKPTALPRFLESVHKASGLSQNTVGEVLRLLFRMYTLHDSEETSVEDFSKTILDSFLAIKGLQIKDESKILARTKRFLRFEKPLGLVVKSAGLAREFDRVFCSAHVYTDVRPVFEDGNLSKPSGAIIMHSLNISYHKAKTHREFYVALTSEELKEVEKAISRAIQKDRAMKSLLEKSSLPYFGE